MIASKKDFYTGAGLLAGFAIVFILIFMPIFNKQNGLDYLDSLYNSISKASADYIRDLQEESGEYLHHIINATLFFDNELQARETAPLFIKAGADTVLSGSQLKVTGNLKAILANCLEDSGYLFENNGTRIEEKYGIPGRQVLYNWWTALKSMEKQLNKQKKFAEAKFVATVKKKGVECSYNYYGIEPQKITEKLGVVIFSLLFYVVYTVWYGFAILFLFQGGGLRLEH